jgi:hypothetical protein
LRVAAAERVDVRELLQLIERASYTSSVQAADTQRVFALVSQLFSCPDTLTISFSTKNEQVKHHLGPPVRRLGTRMQSRTRLGFFWMLLKLPERFSVQIQGGWCKFGSNSGLHGARSRTACGR